MFEVWFQKMVNISLICKRKNGIYVNDEVMKIGVNLFLPLNCLFIGCHYNMKYTLSISIICWFEICLFEICFYLFECIS